MAHPEVTIQMDIRSPSSEGLGHLREAATGNQQGICGCRGGSHPGWVRFLLPDDRRRERRLVRASCHFGGGSVGR